MECAYYFDFCRLCPSNAQFFSHFVGIPVSADLTCHTSVRKFLHSDRAPTSKRKIAFPETGNQFSKWHSQTRLLGTFLWTDLNFCFLCCIFCKEFSNQNRLYNEELESNPRRFRFWMKIPNYWNGVRSVRVNGPRIVKPILTTELLAKSRKNRKC